MGLIIAVVTAIICCFMSVFDMTCVCGSLRMLVRFCVRMQGVFVCVCACERVRDGERARVQCVCCVRGITAIVAEYINLFVALSDTD